MYREREREKGEIEIEIVTKGRREIGKFIFIKTFYKSSWCCLHTLRHIFVRLSNSICFLSRSKLKYSTLNKSSKKK